MNSGSAPKHLLCNEIILLDVLPVTQLNSTEIVIHQLNLKSIFDLLTLKNWKAKLIQVTLLGSLPKGGM